LNIKFFHVGEGAKLISEQFPHCLFRCGFNNMAVNKSLDKSGGDFFSVFESLGQHEAPFLFPFSVNRPDCFVSRAVVVENPCHNHLPY
jgi:hypothetical protein